MLKVCLFNPIPGVGGVYLPPPLNFCHKIQTAIDFSQNFLTFNFYGQLKHDISNKQFKVCF